MLINQLRLVVPATSGLVFSESYYALKHAGSSDQIQLSEAGMTE